MGSRREASIWVPWVVGWVDESVIRKLKTGCNGEIRALQPRQSPDLLTQLK